MDYRSIVNGIKKVGGTVGNAVQSAKKTASNDLGLNREFFSKDVAAKTYAQNPVTRYAQKQVVDPILTGIGHAQLAHDAGEKANFGNVFKAAAPIVQGAFNATPAGLGANAITGGEIAAARMARGQGFKQAAGAGFHSVSEPTSLAKEGFGINEIKHPNASMAIDMVGGLNPRALIRGGAELANLKNAPDLIHGAGTIIKAGAKGLDLMGSDASVIDDIKAITARKANPFKAMEEAAPAVEHGFAQARDAIGKYGTKPKLQVYGKPVEGEAIPGMLQDLAGKGKTTFDDYRRVVDQNGNLVNASGALGGIEPVDDNGDGVPDRYTINPTKAALGVAGMTVAHDPRTAALASKIAGRTVEAGFPIGDPRRALAAGLNEDAAGAHGLAQAKAAIENVIGTDAVSNIKKFVASKDFRNGKVDSSSFPELDVIAEDYRRATGHDVTADEFLRLVSEQPTSKEISNLAPKAKDVKGLNAGHPTLDEPIPLPKPKVDEKIQMRRENAGAVMSVPTKELTGLKKAAAYGASIPRNLLDKTPEGKKIVAMFDGQNDAAKAYAGKLMAPLESSFKGMSKAQRELASDVAEGLTTSNDPAVNRAAAAWKAVSDHVAGNAQKMGVEISTPNGGKVPFTPRDNYVPRMIKDGVLDKAATKQRAIKHILETGQAKTYQEAAGMLEEVKGYAKGKKYGNLERPRLADLPKDFYKRDLSEISRAYVPGASARLTQIGSFGKNGEKLYAAAEEARKAGIDPAYVDKLYKSTIGLNETGAVTKAITKLNRLSSLDYSFVTNLTQNANTIGSNGLTHTIKGIGAAFTDAGKNLAVESGAHLPDTAGKLADAPMGIFRKTEAFNRIVSSNAAASYAKSLAKHPETASAVRQLERLGIKAEDVIGGKLTPKQILTAARKGTVNTQFETNPIDVPLGWQSDIGKLTQQFQSFSVRQGQYLKTELIAEAKKGNFMPAARFAMAATVLGYGKKYAADFLKQTPGYEGTDEKSGQRKVGDALSKINSITGDPITSKLTNLAYAADTLRTKDYEKNPFGRLDRKAGAVAGLVAPVASKIVSAGYNNPGIVNALVQGKDQADRNSDIDAGKYKGEAKANPFRALENFAVRQIPFGDTVANKFLLKDFNNKSNSSQIADASKGNGVVQTKDGTFGAMIDGAPKSFRTKDLADVAVARDKVANGGSDREVIGDKIIVADPSSDKGYKEYSKKDIAEKKATQEYQLRREKAKDSGDLSGWMKEASGEAARIQKRLDSYDQELDADKIADDQNKLYDLAKEAAKYQHYDGFKKPKKAKKKTKAETPTIQIAKVSSGRRAAPAVRKIRS